MPIRPPMLDDRSFDDLVAEALRRIPAHTPEWTHAPVGCPGRTLVELFAWLTDTLLYRVNLVPERQRLSFLRLLGQPLRPAQPARGVVSLRLDPREAPELVQLRAGCRLQGPLPFETSRELSVHPLEGELYQKRALDEHERAAIAELLPDLAQLYGIQPEHLATGAVLARALPYRTTRLFADGRAEPRGVDLRAASVDSCLWIALLAPRSEDQAEQSARLRRQLGSDEHTGPRTLAVGIAPGAFALEGLETAEQLEPLPATWEILSEWRPDAEPRYARLELEPGGDTTRGLRRAGVVRLRMPDASAIGAPLEDLAQDLQAGVGDRPPRLDDPERVERLVAWIRLRPAGELRLAWAGINAVEIEQWTSTEAVFVGASDGGGNQEFQLPGTSVDPLALELQIVGEEDAPRAWRRVDDLLASGRDDAHFELDAEAGTVRFGDGVHGQVPPAGARVRVARMRSGGGAAGNLPAGSLQRIEARDLAGRPLVQKLEVVQGLPTSGGAQAEALAEAERRLPARLRHGERAVTADDYRRLALEAPGARIARAEVLPEFKPHQRRHPVPGVVSVLALPFKEQRRAPNPRPDRPTLLLVDGWLRPRRPLGTELYVMGVEYVQLALSVGLEVQAGHDRDTILQAVRDALRDHLWPLAPGGPEGEGWPLGREVGDRELEVVAARVRGVAGIGAVRLYRRAQAGEEWSPIPPRTVCGPTILPLERWQLPELVELGVAEGDPPALLPPSPDQPEVPVPVVPEVC